MILQWAHWEFATPVHKLVLYKQNAGNWLPCGTCVSAIHCFWGTVYPKKYAYGFVVLCFVVVMQSFIMNSHEVFIHIHQGCFAGTGAIVRLPQCQWSKPDGYGKISQCITTTKHSKAKTVCIFLGIYCSISKSQIFRRVVIRFKPYLEFRYVLLGLGLYIKSYSTIIMIIIHPLL